MMRKKKKKKMKQYAASMQKVKEKLGQKHQLQTHKQTVDDKYSGYAYRKWTGVLCKYTHQV